MNSSNSTGMDFNIESILHDSNLNLCITELICHKPLDIKIQIETLMETINLKNIGFANLMTEKIKTVLNDTLKTMLINCEDLRTLEVNSTILRENSRQLFKDVLRSNRDTKKSIRSLLLASTAVVVMLLLLIK